MNARNRRFRRIRSVPGLLVATAIFLSAAGDVVAHEPAAHDGRTPLATVDGEVWYVEDVKGAVGFRVFQREMDIHALLVEEARRRIDEVLLDREARRRGTSVEQMLEDVMGETPVVSESEIDAYLAENPAKAGVSSAQARTRVRHYLQESRRLARRVAFEEALREKAGAKVLLAQPKPPRSDVDIAGAPSRGPSDAPLVIVHFASLASRTAAKSAAHIAAVMEAHPGAVRHVHRHLFNGRDERGLYAAHVAVPVQEAGGFWQFHDALFELRGKVSRKSIEELADQLGVSPDALENIEQDSDTLRRVKRDLDAAVRLGVQREPSLFLNGRFVSGLVSREEFLDAAREEIERARAIRKGDQ